MPIIERECNQCFYTEENIESRTNADTIITTCPRCFKVTFTKQISKCSFKTSGKGWFKTGGY
jgi:putative FmdB family regulatory protein